ncbi:MAG: peptide/nickel transport system permease protein [Chloroflexi bacterium]|nr:MAG: peptide/nickel transport system permease protein [Chloroflexota bacterium]
MATEGYIAGSGFSPRRVGAALTHTWHKGLGALRLVLRTTSGRIGLPIVLVHAVIFVAGSWLAPYSFTSFNLAEDGTLEQLVGPSRHFLLGTDQFGRDILSRVMSGSTSLIAVAGSGTLLGIAMGSIVGMGSAYMGKWVDEVVMRIMDGLMSFPSLLMALLVISALGPNVLYIVATVAIVTTPGVARVMRSATLTLKEQEFVQSARLRGESAPYIIFREILPNTLPVMGVELTVRLSYSILIVASLGFLGLGVQPPSPDWGLMISQGRQFLSSAPWVALAPAGAVASLIVGVNLLTDGIRQASNMPREVAP